MIKITLTTLALVSQSTYSALFTQKKLYNLVESHSSTKVSAPEQSCIGAI